MGLPSDCTTVQPILATAILVTTMMVLISFVSPATFPVQHALMLFPAAVVLSTGSPTDLTVLV